MQSMIGLGRLPILLLLLLLAGFVSPALALDLNAYWLYRESGGSEIDTRREFQQNYNLGVGPAVTYQLTPAITATAFLGYSRRQRDLGEDQGWQTVDEISPGAQLTVTNDIFVTQLAGYATQTRTSGGAATPSSRSWDATLASAWDIPLWPTLLFNYSERFDETKDADDITTLDMKETNSGVSVSWDLLLAQLDYRYNSTESEDRLSGSLSESDSHFARLETGGKFWDERIRFDLSQQVEYSKNDFSIGELEDGFFDEELEAQAVLSSVTNPNTLPAPLPGETWADAEVGLQPNAALGNGIRDDVTGGQEVDSNLRVHLGVNFSSEEQIDIVHLYLDPLTAPTEAQASSMQWDLYVRPFGSDVGWERAVENIPAAFNSAENRFELTINRPEAQIMVVATNTTANTIRFTEIETFSQLTQDASSTTTSYLTNARMSIRLTPTLRASSNLTLDHSETDPEGFTRTEHDRKAVTGRLSWTPTPYLSPSLGFSQNRETRTNAAELLNRSYSLTVTSIPLPTLNLTLSTTRTDRFRDDEKTEISDNYSLLSTARIYPDLTTSLYANYRNSETLDSDGNVVTTDTYSGRMTVNARINRAVTSDVTANYQRTEREASENSSSDTTLSVKYRPSDILSLTVAGTKFWSGPERSDALGVSLDLRFLRTEKTQATFRYDFRQADDTSNRFGLDWTWDISRALYLQTKTNYTLSQGDTYRIEAFLSFRL